MHEKSTGLLLILLFPLRLEASKILVYSPLISKSHAISNGRIADVLSAAGHDVVVFLPVYVNWLGDFNETTKLAKIVRMKGLGDAFERGSKVGKKTIFTSKTRSISARMHFEDALIEICQAILTRIDELNSLRSYGFDLGMSEQVDFCGLAIIRYLGIRNHIWISSNTIHDTISYELAIPAPLSYVPSVIENDVGDRMDWWQRARNVYMHAAAIFIHLYATSQTTTVFRNVMGPKFPPVGQIARESALVFVHSDEFLDFARPILHKTVYIGGIGIGEPQPLNQKFETIMAKGKLGVIFMSLGTIAGTKDLPKQTKEDIFRTFAAFPDYHFLLKIDADDEECHQFAHKHKNVDVEPWVPQPDLLAHPRLRLFIMHGGFYGMLEAAIRGVPIIAIPIFADQFRNARAAEKRGFGLQLAKEELNYQGLTNAIESVISDRRYKDNAMRLSSLIRNKPFPVERRLVEWTEFVLANGNLPELQVEGANLDFFTYFCLDITIPLGLAIALVAFAGMRALIIAFRIACNRLLNRKLKKE